MKNNGFENHGAQNTKQIGHTRWVTRGGSSSTSYIYQNTKSEHFQLTKLQKQAKYKDRVKENRRVQQKSECKRAGECRRRVSVREQESAEEE